MAQRYYRIVGKGDFLDSDNEKEVSLRLEKLGELIRYHNDLYHVQGTPEIPDSDFDSLWHELIALEQKHPNLVKPDSPSSNVGE